MASARSIKMRMLGALSMSGSTSFQQLADGPLPTPFTTLGRTVRCKRKGNRFPSPSGPYPDGPLLGSAWQLAAVSRPPSQAKFA